MNSTCVNKNLNTVTQPNESILQQTKPLDARGIINNFKANILRTLSEAFERAVF